MFPQELLFDYSLKISNKIGKISLVKERMLSINKTLNSSLILFFSSKILQFSDHSKTVMIDVILDIIKYCH